MSNETLCPICHGTGSIPVESSGPPVHTMCKCRLQREILANAERGMIGLTKQPPVPRSPLLGREEENLTITAPSNWFLPHLRHVAIRQPPTWSFKVVTDAEMMTAWLATASLAGAKIFDADVMEDAAAVSLAKMTLPDLVEPPGLLVVRLGVKVARNVAMSEVFMEALTLRHHNGSPVWLWDQPDNQLAPGHMCFSEYAKEFVSEWPHIDSRNDHTPEGIKSRAQAKKATGSQGKSGSVSDMFFKSDGGSK